MKSRPVPHFELTSVYEDGASGDPELFPVTRVPWEAYSDRRGFLKAGVTASAALAMLGGPATAAAATSSHVGSVLRAHQKSVAGLAFAEDGAHLASVSGRWVRQGLDLAGGRTLVFRFGGPEHATLCRLSSGRRPIGRGILDGTDLSVRSQSTEAARLAHGTREGRPRAVVVFTVRSAVLRLGRRHGASVAPGRVARNDDAGQP